MFLQIYRPRFDFSSTVTRRKFSSVPGPILKLFRNPEMQEIPYFSAINLDEMVFQSSGNIAPLHERFGARRNITHYKIV
jgi:hypothetical protein